MLAQVMAAIVNWCWHHCRLVVLLSLLATVALGAFAATHLGLDTDEGKMLSSDLPFRKAEKAFDKAFPQNADTLVAVIDAGTSAQADDAVNRLAARLASRTDLFRSVRRPPEDVFFRKNGLLYLSTASLTDLSDRLIQAQPMLGGLARDPSLRGMLASIDLALEGVTHGQMTINDLAPMLEQLDGPAAQIAEGGLASPLAWQSLFGDAAAHDRPRRFLLTQPILQYDDLVAGSKASAAIRDAARDLGLTPETGVQIHLTGSVALADANFATVATGVEISAPLSLVAVTFLLFFAVRSLKVVGAILVSLMVGLVATGAFAAATVGTLNPISVAFAVMFVGIAVDFAIQFVIRYRDERYRLDDNTEAAIIATAHDMAGPLSLATVATAIGFLSFLPTAYTGVSQLGLIAGGGMIIALLVDFTVLPALLGLLRTPAETEPVGLPLARADNWLARHAVGVVSVAGLLAVTGALLLPFLPMDFNPLHLQDPKDEAVSIFLDLARDPDNGSYAVDILAPSREAAETLGKKFDPLPEVARVMSIDSFIPDQQDDKLAILVDLAALLGPTLNPPTILAAPRPDDLVKALTESAIKLETAAGKDARATGLATHLRRVAAAGPAAVLALQDSLTSGLTDQLTTLRQMLSPKPIAFADLPADLLREWLTQDGRARLQVAPKDDMEDRAAMLHFVKTVRAIAPNAVGLPVAVEQSGTVVIDAFTQAGLSALGAIAVLLGLMLRRWLDAILVVLPLVMGALYTVIGLKILGIPLNFANIIALPLLLGIGVAFNIYYVVNWRQGVNAPLQSPTTRAVLFSALTTGSAFGSLAVSPHLGTASMGLLLFLSLGLSVLTTFIVMPALFNLLNRKRS
ncbi:MMPL family transporter [Telmatospirillum sp.]|uniref:MMPL family transporter n=1 Tax=Telmatospirillum sp. TaxID=2079197 RepID=UPI00283CD199|nr:MMPL family transporter [Telmatospirillum sp.]MDR3441237.1 MMPL family transporter [Telmatospirillum sp.]